MDTNELITNRQSELQELYDRMDRTKDLVYLTPFQLMKLDGKSKMDRSISITLNDPAVFANAVISDLMKAKKQIVVEGLSDTKNHEIESFGYDAFAQADEFLTAKFGLANLWSWLCNHVCVRSFIGVRWITTIVNGEYNIDCLPVDMRWCPFVLGRWAANITFRNASDIRAEYLEKPGVDRTLIEKLSGKDLEVKDYWDNKVNEVWISGQKVFEQANPFGYPPFVIILPATGFLLRDKGYLAHEAEDLLFLNRDLYYEKNRAVSIEQTLGMAVLEPRYEQETDSPGSEPDPVPKLGQNLKVKKGERHEPVGIPDLNTASMTARQDINKSIQVGGVNDIDLGNVSQTVSAIWITEQSGIRDKFEEPRLQALAAFYQQSHRMLIEQARQAATGRKTTFNAGKTGRRKSYDARSFGDPQSYTIEYQYMTKSRKQELANLSMAEAARGLLPLKNILTDILLVEDPDGTMRELEIEEARQADPAIALFEMALRHAEEAEKLEGPEAEVKKIQSMMLTERGCFIIRQRNRAESVSKGEVTPQVETPQPDSRVLLPLPGSSNGGLNE